MKRVAILLASLLASAPVVARAAPADPLVREVLSSDRYRFCHEKDYPLTPGEHAWCAHLSETNDACPALPAACSLPPVEGDARGLGDGSPRVGRGARDARDARRRDATGPRALGR